MRKSVIKVVALEVFLVALFFIVVCGVIYYFVLRPQTSSHPNQNSSSAADLKAVLDQNFDDMYSTDTSNITTKYFLIYRQGKFVSVNNNLVTLTTDGGKRTFTIVYTGPQAAVQVWKFENRQLTYENKSVLLNSLQPGDEVGFYQRIARGVPVVTTSMFKIE